MNNTATVINDGTQNTAVFSTVVKTSLDKGWDPRVNTIGQISASHLALDLLAAFITNC